MSTRDGLITDQGYLVPVSYNNYDDQHEESSGLTALNHRLHSWSRSAFFARSTANPYLTATEHPTTGDGEEDVDEVRALYMFGYSSTNHCILEVGFGGVQIQV